MKLTTLTYQILDLYLRTPNDLQQSQDAIGKIVYASSTTVARHLAAAEAAGLIRREGRFVRPIGISSETPSEPIEPSIGRHVQVTAFVQIVFPTDDPRRNYIMLPHAGIIEQIRLEDDVFWPCPFGINPHNLSQRGDKLLCPLHGIQFVIIAQLDHPYN